MTIWKLSMDDGEHKGYEFFKTKREAKDYIEFEMDSHLDAEISKIDFKCNKSGIISLMTLHASHPNNG